jgi:exopolysaccharide biosynthesis polyprenyl glycosylphosphotransferase
MNLLIQWIAMRHYNFKKNTLLFFLKAFDIIVMLISLGLSLLVEEISFENYVLMLDVMQIRLKIINIFLLLIFVITWHLIFLSMRLYDSRRLERGREEWKDIVKSVLIGSMVLLATTVVFQRDHVSKETVLLFAVFAGFFTWLARMLMRIVMGRLRRYNRNLNHLLLVGSNDRVHDFASRVMAQPHLGYRILGYIDDPPNGRSFAKLTLPLQSLGTLRDFEAVVDREQIDEVVIALPIRSCYEQIKRIIEACELQGIQAHLLSDFFQLKIAQARPGEFDGLPILTLGTGLSAAWQATLKRVFDLMTAIVLVLLLAPVLLTTAFTIKVSSPEGPIFFVQTRVGYNRRRFKMLKFRTMIPNAEHLQSQLERLNEAQGPVFKMKNDPRITPIGRFLRKTSLDELPQLFNVIKGDMSLVGPRPLPLRDVERFEGAWLKRRFSVKPGLTCLWQINGRSDTRFDKWIEQDLEYIDHWSFSLDLKILIKTIPAVLRGTGAH